MQPASWLIATNLKPVALLCFSDKLNDLRFKRFTNPITNVHLDQLFYLCALHAICTIDLQVGARPPGQIANYKALTKG